MVDGASLECLALYPQIPLPSPILNKNAPFTSVVTDLLSLHRRQTKLLCRNQQAGVPRASLFDHHHWEQQPKTLPRPRYPCHPHYTWSIGCATGGQSPQTRSRGPLSAYKLAPSLEIIITPLFLNLGSFSSH
ncbi:hypothetical protein LIA77_11477 [Sarocladium implicatum]|nr:hypothetical protein LIA77_11477 [Sarocladium implicatum]